MRRKKNINGITLSSTLIKNGTLTRLDCCSIQRAIACATVRLNPSPPLRSRSPGHTSLSISIKRRLPRFRCPNGNADVILNKPFFLAVWTFYQRSSYSAVNLTTEYSTVRELMQRNLIWQHAYLLAYLLGLLGVSLSKIPISGSCKGHSGEPPMLNKWR